jgi:hypothetical protein
MSASDKKKLAAAARLLADYDCITSGRCFAILRTVDAYKGPY